MPATTLYVARHGQTAFNKQQRFQGSTDLPLDEEGCAQAELLAQRLPAGITRIIASPLLRARQTAGYVAKTHGLKVVLMEDFRERDYGVFEGLNRQELETQYAEIWRRKIAQQWDDAPPGGETMRETFQRVQVGLQLLATQQPGETVLLVAHGFVARAVRAILTQQAEADFFTTPMLGNAEFETYSIIGTHLSR
ncbi:MAG TPA: histidine phosphatase family protein [Rhodocyclaceae bacterium]|nr:histidine phosphatase family protein [Rhodocyclaceae bacterium]